MPGIPSFHKESIEEICTPPKIQKYFPKKTRGYFQKRWFIFIFLMLASLISFYFATKEKGPSPFLSLKGPSPDFIGRKQIIETLYQNLVKSNGSLKINILGGKGGFGKSEIAAQFGNLYHDHFSFVWTFLCDSKEHLEQGYRDLSEKLGLFNSNELTQGIIEKVHFHLENHPFKKPWLLIFDNVENENILYPQRGGAILMTSQKRIFNPEYWVEVPPFSLEESLTLLEKITLETRSSEMERLAKDLDGIPLLVNSAGHYIKATPGCTISEYQQLFNASYQEKFGPLWRYSDVNGRYLKSLATSWLFPLKSLEKDNPLALQWLYVCSYLYRELIPEDWIGDWLLDQGNFSLEIEKKEILKSLQKYDLIRYDEKTKTFSIHPFFQSMLRESRKNYLENDLGQAVTLLEKHAEDFQYQQMSTWRKGWLFYVHGSEIRRHLHHNSAVIEKAKQVKILKKIGIWCLYNDVFSISLEVFNEALDLLQHEKDNMKVAAIHRYIGWDLYRLGRYSEGLAHCKKAMDIQELYFDEFPLKFATSLNTKGCILSEMGEYEEAVRCHEHALAIRKKHGDEKYISYSLHNLGICFTKMGRHQEALTLFEEVHILDKKFLGENHPLALYSVIYKGITLADLGKSSEALSLFQKIEQKFPKDNPYLARLWNGMGKCYLDLCQFKNARRRFKKAYQLEAMYCVKNNTAVLSAYQGIGWSYIKQNHFKKGLKYLSKAKELSEILYRDAPKKKVLIDEDFEKALEFTANPP